MIQARFNRNRKLYWPVYIYRFKGYGNTWKISSLDLGRCSFLWRTPKKSRLGLRSVADSTKARLLGYIVQIPFLPSKRSLMNKCPGKRRTLHNTSMGHIPRSNISQFQPQSCNYHTNKGTSSSQFDPSQVYISSSWFDWIFLLPHLLMWGWMIPWFLMTLSLILPLLVLRLSILPHVKKLSPTIRFLHLWK